MAFVLTSADGNETRGFRTQYCGWHTHGTIGGTQYLSQQNWTAGTTQGGTTHYPSSSRFRGAVCTPK